MLQDTLYESSQVDSSWIQDDKKSLVYFLRNNKNLYNTSMQILHIRSPRAKNLRITIKWGTIRVTRPFWCSQKKAEKFITEKKIWIQKHIQDQQQIRSTDIKNTNRYISLSTEPLADITLPWHAQELDEGEKDAIILQLRKYAKIHLSTRLTQLASIHNLPCDKISIRHQSSRWWSCSSQNNISLNIELIRLPDELIDYVLLHELAHTVHKHHQKPFWDFLDTICPNSKKLDSKLKNEKILLK